MRHINTFFLWIVLGIQSTFAQTTFIHVDQFGYYPTSTKVAVLSDPQLGFNATDSYSPGNSLEVVNTANDQVVFSAAPSIWSNGDTDGFSGDKGWWFDFSSVSQAGTYIIRDPQNNVQSHPFEISSNPYGEVLKAAGRMFFYNRCNMEKAAPYADAKWTDGNNFNKPLQDLNCRFIFDRDNATLERDLSGGWFDAGDYNKYVTFTHSTLHDLLGAYRANPEVFGDDWNIPESGNGIPDILDEIKWELDWMFKMTNPDGSVIVKMGSQNHSENAGSPPSVNTDQRFYGNTCTSASATVASTFAHAALIFQGVSGFEGFVQDLINTAENTFAYVLPRYNNGTLETNCDDLSIVAGDADQSPEVQRDALVIAAIYLFELTQNNSYQQFIIDNAGLVEPLSAPFWGPYKVALEDALIRYAKSPNANQNIANTIINSASTDASNNWNGFFGMNDRGLYRDYMPDWSYHWGSNNPKAGYGNLNLLLADQGLMDAPNGRLKASELLHAFHGVNPLGMVNLSNMYPYGAENSANEIYHVWFADGTIYDNALSSPNGPAPGYVVGGPNKDFSVPSVSPPSGQPISKSYLDFNDGWPESSWEITEPAIYYQAAYIRLLAGIMGLTENISTSVRPEFEPKACLKVFPNPARDEIRIEGQGLYQKVELFNMTGQLVREASQFHTSRTISLEGLDPGAYFIRAKGIEAGNVCRAKVVVK